MVAAALALLEAVVAYSMVPRAAHRAFVAALCRTVNLEHHCQPSWKLMRSVLGADMGHAALQQLVALLRAGGDEAGLQRGAVFYVNMALWGPRRVPTLRVSYLAVLPAFLKVDHQIFLYVSNSIERISLISRCSHLLMITNMSSWRVTRPQTTSTLPTKNITKSIG